jgi:hypothetical protein
LVISALFPILKICATSRRSCLDYVKVNSSVRAGLSSHGSWGDIASQVSRTAALPRAFSFSAGFLWRLEEEPKEKVRGEKFESSKMTKSGGKK